MSRTPWGQALTDALADGEWHHIGDVRAAIERAVPAPVAMRRFETQRASHAKHHGYKTHVDLPADRAIRVGRLRISSEAILSRVRQGTVERDGDMVRRRL